MAKAVKGKDAIIEALVDAVYLPFACGQDLTISEETEMVEATTSTSTLFRDYRPLFSTWRVSFSGVYFIAYSGKYLANYLFTNAVRRNGLSIRVRFADSDGETAEFIGKVLIPSKSISVNASGLAKWAAEMQGTGQYTLNNSITITPNPEASIMDVEYFGEGGEYTFIVPEIIGKTVRMITRGYPLDKITTGTPTELQAKWSTVDGRITLAASAPLMTGELIHILYN